MPLDPPPEIFVAPTASPVATGAVFAPGFSPGTPPAPPAPAAAAPVEIGAVFAAPAGIYDLFISGDITNDVLTPSVIPALPPVEPVAGKPAFGTTDGFYGCAYGTYWQIWDDVVGVSWRSLSTAASPELVPSGAWHVTDNPNAWRPYGSTLGTPVVRLSLRVPAAIGPAALTPGTPPAPPAPASAAPQSVGAVFAPGYAPATPPTAFVAPTASPVTPPVITP